MYDFVTLHPRAGRGSEKWDDIPADLKSTVVPLSVADMEFRTAPEIVQAVCEMAEFGLWGYTRDDDEYRASVQRWMLARHDWQIDARWIVPMPGVVPALYTAVRAHTAPGNAVVVQPPVYPPFFGAVRDNGRKIIENPLVRDGMHYRMDLDGLRKAVRQSGAKMLILCSPHNPTGRVWTKAELEALAEVCRENGLLVLADEVHCDIVMPPHRHTPFATLASADMQNLIVATSASKTFSLAGLACANLLIPGEELRNRFKQQRAVDCTYFNSAFGAVATKAAYQKGASWLDAALRVIHQNYNELSEYISKKMPALRVVPLQGTYLAWVDCSALGMPPSELETFLQQEAQLYVNNGANFGTGGEGFIRINLACPTWVLKEALKRLETALVKRYER